MNSSRFRFIEKCLYTYPVRKALFNQKRLELAGLSSAHGQSYDSLSTHDGGPGDPVGVLAERAETLEAEICKLARELLPIAGLHLYLKTSDLRIHKQLLAILELKYFCKQDRKIISDSLRISISTYTRRRRKLVFLTSAYYVILGFLHGF